MLINLFCLDTQIYDVEPCVLTDKPTLPNVRSECKAQPSQQTATIVDIDTLDLFTTVTL